MLGSEAHVGAKLIIFLTLVAKSLDRVWSAGYACAFTDGEGRGAEGTKASPNRVFLNYLRELVCHGGMRLRREREKSRCAVHLGSRPTTGRISGLVSQSCNPARLHTLLRLLPFWRLHEVISVG